MRTALLVIDVQRGLFDPIPRPWEAQVVVERINSLTGRARAAGAPVAFVQHEVRSGALQYGTPAWELELQLQVAAADARIRKTTPDAFLDTGLGAWLAGKGVGTVVVCGYASEFCVDTTTRRAAALGLDVVLVADAHTTHDKPHASAAQIRAHHNATLPNITSFGPRIRAIASAEVVFSH